MLSLILSMIFSVNAETATPAKKQPTPATQNYAVADLESKSGSKVTGNVRFSETPAGMRVEYDIKGLPGNSEHGFHVHEHGNCQSVDAKSAGKHYMQVAPTGGTAKDSPAKHAGDFPMIKSDASG